jgi:ProP effector
MLSSQTLTLKKSLSVEKQTQMEQITGKMSPTQDKIQRHRKAMDWLMQAFPQCFNLKASMPLKVGIAKEVMEKWVYLSSLPYDHQMPSRLDVRQVIGWYTRRFLYHKSFETATHRIDLDGKEAGEITQAEKEYARQWVKALKERWKARKAD